MNRTDWAVLALRIFALIVRVQAIYYSLGAAMAGVLVSYDVLFRDGDLGRVIYFFHYAAPAILLYLIAWVLNARTEAIVEQTEEISSNALPRIGVELTIVAIIVVATSTIVPAFHTFCKAVSMQLAFPDYEDPDMSRMESQLFFNGMLPSAVEMALAGLLLFFAKPLASFVLREPKDFMEEDRPADVSA